VYDDGSKNGKFDSGDTLIRLNRASPKDGDLLLPDKKIRYVETGGTPKAWDDGETVIYDGNDKGEFDVFAGQAGMSPDASKTPSNTKYPAGTRPFADSWKTIPGYRPQVQSLPTETPPTKGDYVVIQKKKNGDLVLLRADDSIGGKTNSGFSQVGGTLPKHPVYRRNDTSGPDVVQTAGGHNNTAYYIGDGQHIWRWRGDMGSDGQPKPWELIVPSSDGSSTVARRFFVDPWNASLLYLIDDNGVRRSNNGGDTGTPDVNLSKAISGNNTWQLDQCTSHGCLLNDMAFDPTNGQRRFAAGLAGVFFTADGTRRFRLLDTRAIPSRPLSLWFDPVTDSNNATLFVTSIGRGILRLHPNPGISPGNLILVHNGGFKKRLLTGQPLAVPGRIPILFTKASSAGPWAVKTMPRRIYARTSTSRATLLVWLYLSGCITRLRRAARAKIY
jgi:hypothetical protein